MSNGPGIGGLPGLPDPTRNPEVARALLKERQAMQRQSLRPWERAVIRWLFIGCMLFLGIYALLER